MTQSTTTSTSLEGQAVQDLMEKDLEIRVTKVKENPDGSADIEIDTSPESWQRLHLFGAEAFARGDLTPEYLKKNIDQSLPFDHQLAQGYILLALEDLALREEKKRKRNKLKLIYAFGLGALAFVAVFTILIVGTLTALGIYL